MTSRALLVSALCILCCLILAGCALSQTPTAAQEAAAEGSSVVEGTVPAEPASPAEAPEPQTAHGLPGRLTSLADLGEPLTKANLSAPERVEVLLKWLGQERANPTPATTGLAGGTIDSGYIQAQIILTLWEQGDPQAMTAAVEAGHLAEGVRDGAILALGMMGDASRIPRLLDILAAHPEGYYRALAARALGMLGAAEARTALREALNDQFAVQAGNCTQGLYTAYPVREAAQAALRKLASEAAMTAAQERRGLFAERMRARPLSPTAEGQ